MCPSPLQEYFPFAAAVVPQANPLSCSAGIPCGIGLCPGYSISNPALCSCNWESRRKDPLHPPGDLEEAPGTWLRTSPAPTVAAISGVSHRWKILLSLFYFLPLSPCLSNKFKAFIGIHYFKKYSWISLVLPQNEHSF